MSIKRAALPDHELFHLLPEALLPEALQHNAAQPDSPFVLRVAELMDEFQRDVAFGRRHLAESISKSAEYLIPKKEQTTLPPSIRAILDRYALVDSLALYYRDQTRTAFVVLLAIAFLAMLFLELFAHILPDFFPSGSWPRRLLWLYPILWFSAWAVWYHAHRRQYQKKYHDYRALAEGLRVQFFWKLLGLPDKIEEYYLRKQQGELEWIRLALRYWRMRDEKAISDSIHTDEQSSARQDLVRRLWVLGQLEYFAKVAGPREKRKSKRCKRWGAYLFWASLALSLILIGCEIWHNIQPLDSGRGLSREESVLVFAISMLITTAAIVIAYGEKMAFSEHARQYGATSILFQNTATRLATNLPAHEEFEQFRILGREALQENGDWLLLHRDRPLEVIVP